MIQTIDLTCSTCGITIPTSTQLPVDPPSFTCAKCAALRFDKYQFYKRFDRYAALRESQSEIICQIDDGIEVHVMDLGFAADEIGSGQQIKKARRPERRRAVPSWIMNDKQLSQLEKELRRERRGSLDADRAMKALQLYFRMRLSITEVAAELRAEVNAAKCLIKRLVKRGNAFFRPLTNP